VGFVVIGQVPEGIYIYICRCQFVVLGQEMALVIILAFIAHHTPDIAFRQTLYMLLGEFIFPVRPKRNQCSVFGIGASWHSTALTTKVCCERDTALWCHTETRDSMRYSLGLEHTVKRLRRRGSRGLVDSANFSAIS
jgi:hypothetical protein